MLFRSKEHKEHTKNKEFLTSSLPEIHCNSISRVFDPSFSQIEGYLVFKSKSNVHFLLVNAVLVLCVCNKKVYYTYNAQSIAYK